MIKDELRPSKKYLTGCKTERLTVLGYAGYVIRTSKKTGMSLDRIDSNGNYCPENYRCAVTNTLAFNTSRTRQITYKGETVSLHGMARKYGLTEAFLRYRLNHGWSIKKAITTKVGGQDILDNYAKRLEYDRQVLTLKKHAARLGIKVGTIRTRLNRGYSLEHVFAPVKKRNKHSLSS